MNENEIKNIILSFDDIRDFYKTSTWKTFRKKVMKKKKNRCECCWNGGKDGKGIRRYRKATVLHHIKHLREFPELAVEESNMKALCTECHIEEHPEEYKKTKIIERWD